MDAGGAAAAHQSKAYIGPPATSQNSINHPCAGQRCRPRAIEITQNRALKALDPITGRAVSHDVAKTCSSLCSPVFLFLLVTWPVWCVLS